MSETEAQTRSELIDKQLAVSGWNVKDPTQVVEEFDILVGLPQGVAEPRTRYEGHQFSDYVLLGKNGKPLAVIEAKKSSRDPAVGREQARALHAALLQRVARERDHVQHGNGHGLADLLIVVVCGVAGHNEEIRADALEPLRALDHLRHGVLAAVEQRMANRQPLYDEFAELLLGIEEAITDTVAEQMRIFGSAGQA